MEKKRITKEEFYATHVACPDCDNTELQVTLVSVIDWGEEDFVDNFNRVKCKCGWEGLYGDLLPPIEGEVNNG